MSKELTVLDDYVKRVYKIIMLIVPLSCLSASIAVTILHYLGFFPIIDTAWLWSFNIMDISFVCIGLYFILTGFDTDGSVKTDKLLYGKYAVSIMAILQWNAISYIWPFRELWAFVLLFLLGEAFFFDVKLVAFTSVGLLSSMFVSWSINGDLLLPIHGDFFIAEMTFRFICISSTVMCINILTYFGGKFLVEELEKYIYNDPLTHLMTRKNMDRYIKKAYDKAKKSSDPFCLLMMDIDDFKKVNDTYGHHCGDVILKMVSNVISSSIRNDDKAFRWGGEEFLILLSTDLENAADVAEKIRNRIEHQSIRYKGDNPISVTVTIGITAFDSSHSIDELMESADKKLYKGKHNGKNQVVYAL